jgi:hypothetical protein
MRPGRQAEGYVDLKSDKAWKMNLEHQFSRVAAEKHKEGLRAGGFRSNGNTIKQRPLDLLC